jgi:hypothetical protein
VVQRKTKEIIAKLSAYRERLNEFDGDFSDNGEAEDVYERFNRWRQRAVKYLVNSVSTVEAANLAKKRKRSSNPFNDLTKEIKRTDALLLALVEALEDDPDSVLNLDANPVTSPLSSQSSKLAYEVFVSYSSLDQDQATLIYNAITRIGKRAFLSAKTLRPGDDFADEIRRHLVGSGQVWLLVSPNSLKSEWVLTEWGAAWVLGKKIVPILYRCRPDELPDRLRRLHSIDFDRYTDLV